MIPNSPESGSKINLRLFLICCVLCLTLVFALGAGAMIFFGPSPLTPPADRLFDELLSFAAAGFFGILGLLAGHGHTSGQ
jgi:hypothetical protein